MFHKFYGKLSKERAPLDTSFDDDEILPISEESDFTLTEKYKSVHVTKEFYMAIVNLLNTPNEDSKRIFTKILKKLSPIENWNTTLDEYEAQDITKATIGKRYSIF
jgi:hypothetical protein